MSDIKGVLDVTEHVKVHGAGLSEFFGPVALYSFVWYGRQAADFDTTAWGANEAGRLWYNNTEKRFKYWDGTEIKPLGGIEPDDRNETILETLDGLVAWGRRITYSVTEPLNPEPRDIWLEPTT